MENLNFKLLIWRQAGPDVKGKMVPYEVKDISPDMSFLEMLDVLNESLIKKGEDPIAFDSDCREGICGTCGLVVNGVAHGPVRKTATCQIYMRIFKNNSTITIEPFRAKAFPVIKDLVVDRSAFERIISKGGYVSANTGSAIDANAINIPKEVADKAMDAAACIGCGACVAACPNASASLLHQQKFPSLLFFLRGNQKEREEFFVCQNKWTKKDLVTVQTMVNVKLSVQNIFQLQILQRCAESL